MVSNQQFRLKWNNHRNTVLQEFETLLHKNSFVDCTIGADGKYLKAHKIVLSACSPYLQNVFSEHFDKHPVILLKDVSFKELKCMIDYMYCGEVNISECELPSFLRTAQSLKIKGLAEDINEYDSASDNEQQETSSLTENGRTVEPNVEIHDDEGPPAKKSAPSLIYSNFAGRKRKSPNNAVSSAAKSSNSNEKVPPSAPLSSKSTGGNVPSSTDNENSDNKVSTAGKENNLHKEEPDADKKIISKHNHQENVKSKAEVKEEPLDADDDNSSYEFVNNPNEDSDPLNEDSESNCATSGKNFNEVSIASVSSCNEGEANDDDDLLEIKEEIQVETMNSFGEQQDEDEEHKIRVRSTTELMSFDYVNGGDENYHKEVIVNLNSIDRDVFHNVITGHDDQVEEDDSNTEVIEVKALLDEDEANAHEQLMRVLPRRSAKLVGRAKFTARGRKRKSTNRLKTRNVQTTPQQFRKILPAPIKTSVLPTGTTLLPMPIASSLSYAGGSAGNTPEKTATCSTVPGSGPSYRLINVSKNMPNTSIDSNTDDKSPLKEQQLTNPSDDSFAQNSSALLNRTGNVSTSSTGPESSSTQPIILFNPTTRVVLLNSESPAPLYTIPRLPSNAKVTSSGAVSGGDVRKISYIQATELMKRPKKVVPKIPTIINPSRTLVRPVSITKFRKIAPLVKDADNAGSSCVPCKSCFKNFADEDELRIHYAVCAKAKAEANLARRGRRKNVLS